MDLFEAKAKAPDPTREPLASRMRPRTLDEVLGQDRILGEGRLLRRAIEADRLSSIILYGPPGCGKTSIAEVIARVTSRHFERTSGVTANVSVLRGLFELAAHHRRHEGVETILFIDEIHRFNKSQQDVLLPHVEDGTITLIGATTHNPQFFINSPLTSRSLIFELDPLSTEAIVDLLQCALDEERGLARSGAVADEDALRHLAEVCEGDARRALNALEVAALTTEADDHGAIHITREVSEDSIQRKAVVYDRDEEGHYDTISAFIKSVRGSDPDAAVYWLAKMLYAGEDPRFVARRLVILASEDIGNADPRGLDMAVSAMQGVEFVGMPEARIILSQATTYLASAPKSNAAYLAVDEAMKDVEEGRTLAVPLHLRNVKVKSVDGKQGDDYVYPHECEGHFTVQEYAPTMRRYYRPTDEGYEATLRKRMAHWATQREQQGGAA
ncbi:MAG: replication-associated recombination protein A [Verrucomicrobia bacterium]|jgi:putative ATPase|nr:replication-associated recombination protein A [Verrucomicrobiota bacterium]MBT7067523.1 replication-associated recombination protein A [Verrucomicrobiota bacterium]MBT7699088.1 replication-associated recombination protein A [Verrucomicrobiota bacterium]